jgi:pyochelin biosynthesis protein PchG
MTRRPKVVVVGARFGQVYLEAFREPALPFTLAGILAGGSERSQQCARRYQVPLFTAPEQLPDDIELAAVVIRGGLLGGRGSEVARTLMARGIHVLQEHPLHHDELAQNLRVAREHRVVYHLNPFYTHTEPVRRFIAAGRELLRRREARYLDAACGFQLAYSMLDIIASVVGRVGPWHFGPLPELPAAVSARTTMDIPFRSLDGVLAGVPTVLRVQNQMDPADPDNYAHLMHRVSIGTEAGNLTLVSTHGPVVWSARPDFPREVADPTAAPHYATRADQTEAPSGLVLGPAEVPPYRQLFRTVWPAGVGHALGELHDAAVQGQDPLRRGQYHLSLCRLWQDLTARLGPPELLHSAPPQALTDVDLKAMAAAADGVAA